MKKNKISPTQLAKFIAMFDVDERVDSFEGNRGMILEMKDLPPASPVEEMPNPFDVSHFRRQYRRMDFRFPGELIGRANPLHLIFWEEV